MAVAVLVTTPAYVVYLCDSSKTAEFEACNLAEFHIADQASLVNNNYSQKEVDDPRQTYCGEEIKIVEKLSSHREESLPKMTEFQKR